MSNARVCVITGASGGIGTEVVKNIIRTVMMSLCWTSTKQHSRD